MKHQTYVAYRGGFKVCGVPGDRTMREVEVGILSALEVFGNNIIRDGKD